MSREPHAWASAHLRTSTPGTSSPARDLGSPGVRHGGSRDDHASATRGTGWARRAPGAPRDEIEVSTRALGTCRDAGARTSAEVARCQRENRGARGDDGERPGADARRHGEASSHRGVGECRRGASWARRGVRSCRREAHGRCGGAHPGHRAAVVKCGGAGACPREAVACRHEARPSRRRARDREGRNRALGREGASRCSGACERRRGARLPPGRVGVCCPEVVGRRSGGPISRSRAGTGRPPTWSFSRRTYSRYATGTGGCEERSTQRRPGWTGRACSGARSRWTCCSARSARAGFA